MDIALQLFKRIEKESGDAVDSLDGVLTIDGLPHQRVIIVGVVITDPPAELLGEPVEYWGQCVPAGHRELPEEPPKLWERVTLSDPEERGPSFLLPVLVLVTAFGDYEVAVYARRTEIARAPLVIAPDL